MSLLTSFPLFIKLPAELQLLIWQHAAAPENESTMTIEFFSHGLQPSYHFYALWTTRYAVFLDKIAWLCKGAYTRRKQMMGITRYTRQLAFEAWKSDIERLFKDQPSTRPDPFGSGQQIPYIGGCSVRTEVTSNPKALLRSILGQLELFEDLAVAHPTFWGQSPWNAAHKRLDMENKWKRKTALEQWHKQGVKDIIMRGCPCGGSTSVFHRISCCHNCRPHLHLAEVNDLFEY